MPVSEHGAVAPTFTNGPWEAVPTEYENEYDIVSYATEPGIAIAQHVSCENMHAIAALPELVEALQRCVVVLGGEALSKSSLNNAISSGLSALAKARGEA